MGLRGPKPHTWEICIEKIQNGSSLKEDTGCFIWNGRTAGEGYGYMRCDAKDYYIHRLVFEHMICNELPEVVRHTCDTPRCWNPEHLKGGTHQDNVDDKINKGRHLFGEKMWISKLTNDQVRDIKGSELSMVALAKKYNVARATIHKILNGTTWRHI